MQRDAEGSSWSVLPLLLLFWCRRVAFCGEAFRSSFALDAVDAVLMLALLRGPGPVQCPAIKRASAATAASLLFLTRLLCSNPLPRALAASHHSKDRASSHVHIHIHIPRYSALPVWATTPEPPESIKVKVTLTAISTTSALQHPRRRLPLSKLLALHFPCL